ncbi:SusC/RagA family TonB-linked outer membrane protein [Xanthomarina gelatinilytica]|uniref:SusC/RagA family TonB-linked outer membrane protein n=1 Tax=Xanthomarina gelatinilytica TaxID=1137281 RepID=UPI003AA8D108
MKNNYRRSLALTFTFALFLTYNSPFFSQNLPLKAISGTITDADGPLSGVNVLVKNTARGSISDLEGRYSVKASANDTLVFTYVGYKTQEVSVGSLSGSLSGSRSLSRSGSGSLSRSGSGSNGDIVFNVVMEVDAQALDAVVINAGYYKVSDREKTGSIARVTAAEIGNQPINNPLEALQGRLSGVNIVTTSGVPGAGLRVRIRGQNSIMGANEPLYIIDGIPFDSQSLSSHFASGGIIPRGNASPISAINPETIESIEVLKDADVTAIYGSRGANGVVLITTKQGKTGQTKYTIGSSTGIAHITQKREMLTTEQYLEMRREAFLNDGIAEYPEYAYDINGTWDQDRNTDWEEMLIGHTANTKKIEGSVSGGRDNTKFYINGMYQNETSVFPGNFNYDRITVNSNLHHSDREERISLDINAGYSLEDNDLPGSDPSYNATYLPPNAPALYDEEGNINWADGTWNNPIAQFENKYKSKAKTLFSSLGLAYRPWPEVEVKINSGYGASSLFDRVIAPHTAFNPAWGMTSANSMLTTNEGNKTYWILEPQLNWKRSWDNMALNVLLGSTFQKQEFNQYGLYGIGFPTNDFITNLSAATTILVNNELNTQYNTQSWFARINYEFKEKLFLNITGRRDGSSRFGSGNKYGNFGALGGAYVFSDDLGVPWLSYGKLRASYGITGNDQIGDYQYLRTFTITEHSYNGNIGLQPARLYNPEFKWEENRKGEVALEIGLLKNTILLTTAYYNNFSTNQLINYSLPTTTGFNVILTNLDAEVQNRGWEFDLSTFQFQTENFKWSSSLNLSFPKNKLLAFPDLENSTYANKFVIGQPLDIVKLYMLKGVNAETGLFEFEDFNNDGELTAKDDRQYIADLSPKYFGGINNSLRYRKWQLDVFFQWVKKKGYNQYRLTEPSGTMANQPVTSLDRWQQPGDVATMQRYTTGADPEAYMAYYRFTQSSGIISDASFIRLKTLSLAYNLSGIGRAPNSCRIFLTGQNLLTFTKFEGGDPEQADGYLPPLTRLSFGFQLNL